MKTTFLIIFFLFSLGSVSSQTPVFGPEIKVNIIGLTHDAMEPFISIDGNTLFFNSLNSGGNTNLYYATKVNDSTFNYMGLLGGCYDSGPNHLDGVASLDSLSRFFWVSLRNYPAQFDNLHTGVYGGSFVSNLHRVHGTFNTGSLGWLIMDAAISVGGDELYYSNAYFDFINNSCGTGVPCMAALGLAQRVNDSTFNKISNSDAIFANINDTNYLVYAPQLSKNGLELYYTRLLKTTVNTEICVSQRNNPTDAFSLPSLIHSNNGFIPEAATISSDMQKIYYHQKDVNSLFKIYLRYRNSAVGNSMLPLNSNFIELYPNPVAAQLNINSSFSFDEIKICDVFSHIINADIISQNKMDVSKLSRGLYYVYLYDKSTLKAVSKFIKH